MDKVTVTDKRSKATSPNVASAKEIPQAELFGSCSKGSSQFLESASSSDESSLSFSSSSSFSDEPLNDFSEMLAQLPIKRGLSKFYKGKSRAFTSLSDVKCVEDLAKRQIPQRKRAQNSHSPMAVISKKACKSYFTSLVPKWS
ncbi:hypothetical protein K1719_022393 [Acacia pycnantha]|nr:hypothetical protein K1719_022393 [Acacia pycnantha]